METIKQQMENFYNCTHLPLTAFNTEGTSFLYIGHTEKSLDLFHKYFSYETTQDLEKALGEAPFVNINLEEDITFTLCPLEATTLEHGLFVIGPYTTKAHLHNNLLFKPAHCISPLVNLLYMLKEVPERTMSKLAIQEHNYHVSKAIAYIELNYSKSISLDELTNYLGIHKSYFCTLFKKITTESFSTYLNKFRIEKSKYLLAHTTDCILDIALATGFSSASYFNTTFKKLMHQTPIAYRNQHFKL